MSRRRWILPLLLACLSACTAGAERRDPLDAGRWRSAKSRMYHDLALQCLRSGDHARARNLLEQAVGYDAREPRTLELLARLAYAAGDLEGARRAASTLLLVAPGSVAALCTLGAIAEDEERPAEAEASYQQALLASTDDPRPGVDLHRLYLDQGRDDAAAELRRTLQQRFPRSIELLLDRGALHAAQGSWGDAAAAYGAALDSQPGNADAAASYALCAVLDGQAEAALTAGSRLPPRSRASHGELALALATARMRQGDCAAALAELDQLDRTRADRPGMRTLRGELLFRLGRLDAARDEFEAALLQEPRLCRAHVGLGRIALLQGQHHVAVRTLQRALELEPRAGTSHALLAAALAATGDLAGARRHLQRARQLPGTAALVAECQRIWPDLAETRPAEAGR